MEAFGDFTAIIDQLNHVYRYKSFHSMLSSIQYNPIAWAMEDVDFNNRTDDKKIYITL